MAEDDDRGCPGRDNRFHELALHTGECAFGAVEAFADGAERVDAGLVADDEYCDVRVCGGADCGGDAGSVLGGDGAARLVPHVHASPARAADAIEDGHDRNRFHEKLRVVRGHLADELCHILGSGLRVGGEGEALRHAVEDLVAVVPELAHQAIRVRADDGDGPHARGEGQQSAPSNGLFCSSTMDRSAIRRASARILGGVERFRHGVDIDVGLLEQADSELGAQHAGHGTVQVGFVERRPTERLRRVHRRTPCCRGPGRPRRAVPARAPDRGPLRCGAWFAAARRRRGQR